MLSVNKIFKENAKNASTAALAQRQLDFGRWKTVRTIANFPIECEFFSRRHFQCSIQKYTQGFIHSNGTQWRFVTSYYFLSKYIYQLWLSGNIRQPEMKAKKNNFGKNK